MAQRKPHNRHSRPFARQSIPACAGMTAERTAPNKMGLGFIPPAAGGRLNPPEAV